MYTARKPSDIEPLANDLAREGILVLDDIYSVAELGRINAAFNPIFAAREAEARSYVRPDDMLESGVLDLVLNRRMKDVLLSVTPNPVLYHLHAYEIAARNTKSHIFSDQLGGWHRDPDSTLISGDPTHVSIFVYLSDVGPEDGPFEFSPHNPESPLRSDSPVVSMTGETGLSFIWHRSFYHRASPNRGARRRRVLKISFQPNQFESVHLNQPFFRNAIERVPPGDLETDLLFGRYQAKPDCPSASPQTEIRFRRITERKSIDVPDEVLSLLKQREAEARDKVAEYD